MKKALIIISLLNCSNLFANTQDELRRLHKCHAIFVSERITSTSPLWKEVEQGLKTGTEACMEILDWAKFDSNGKIAAESSGSYDMKKIKILKNFLFFYKAQFQVPSFGPGLNPDAVRTVDFTDANEPAYHFLYSLFKDDEPFSKIVTRPHGLRATRYTTKAQRHRSITTIAPTSNLFYDTGGRGEAVFGYAHFIQGELLTTKDENGANVYQPHPTVSNPAIPFFPTPVETGLLIGLKADTVHNFITELPLKNLPLNHPWNDANGHYGGGVLGTQAYMIANMTNRTESFMADGGTKLQRRYGENVLADFLCRANPPLRPMDVVSEVKSNSNIPFRKGISCMRCHSGMDPLSGVARHLVWATSHKGPRSGQLGFITKKTITNSERVLWAEIDRIPNYNVSEPIGRLFYRSYDGSLVKEDLEGISDLGQKISQKNDFYVCAAKRHYQLLTGIEVNLQDPGDIDSVKLTRGEEIYREKVIKLGLELKEHKSLRTLIKKIIESPTFIYTDKGV